MRDPVADLADQARAHAVAVDIIRKQSAEAAMYCGEHDLRWIDRIHQAASDLHFALTCWYSLSNRVTSTGGDPSPR